MSGSIHSTEGNENPVFSHEKILSIYFPVQSHDQVFRFIHMSDKTISENFVYFVDLLESNC